METIYLAIFLLGFSSFAILWKIMYHIVWYNFERKGKKHDLKIGKCKDCGCRFYKFDFETTILCGNCSTLRIASEKRIP